MLIMGVVDCTIPSGPQRPRLPSTGARKHDADGPKAHHALTFKLDHMAGALHAERAHKEKGDLS
jgi:hypothetical protein